MNINYIGINFALIFCIVHRFFGSREESKVSGFFVFSHIRMMGYVRLVYIRVNECPAGLEPPVEVRKEKPATSDSSLDPNIF